MNGWTASDFPFTSLSITTWENAPIPPAGMTSSATRAEKKSASLASDVPPGAVARNRIRSAFNVVGRSTTVAPFDSVHSVTSPFRRCLDDAPFRRRTFHQRPPGACVDIGGHCSGRSGFDRGGQLRFGGRHPSRNIRRQRDHQPIRFRKPVRRQRVHFVQRDLRQEAAVKRQLLPDGWQGFTLEKVARVFVGAARRFAIGALLGAALGGRQVRLFRPVKFGGGEAECGDAFQLAHQRVESAGDAVVRHQGLQRRFVARLRRRKQAAAGGGAQERRPSPWATSPSRSPSIWANS